MKYIAPYAMAISLLLNTSGNLCAKVAPELPFALREKVKNAEKACRDFDNGKFVLDNDAIERIDLDGDGLADWVVNETGFSCSSAASLYGGTGGSMSHFLVGGKVASILNQGWEVVRLAQHVVVLIDVHGSQCGGINPTPCVTSSVWDSEGKVWRTAKANWE